ncbi:MAG: TonB family protein [Acidobacteriota bacterium]|nr:TonB family protein [Acidobacteriota bacterium]
MRSAGPALRAGVSSLAAEGMVLRDEGMFASLWSNVRDVFFPQKLPPLVLESTPIAVVDRMKTRQDPRATAASFVIYAVLLALIGWMLKQHVQFSAPNKTAALTELTPPPPQAPPKAQAMGGGGGQKGPTPVAKGALPKFADTQITPPAPPPLQEQKIKMPQPTIEVQKDLKMASNNMPNFGMPNSPVVGNSLGNGNGTGIGPGSGSGLGPGSGGNYGGGVRRIGGGVSRPELLYQVDPEFSEEARKAKFMGTVLVDLIVDAQGRPQNVRVVRGVGMGLDEKALEAVRQYKFRPAMEGGKPVAVEMNVEVNFQIF